MDPTDRSLGTFPPDGIGNREPEGDGVDWGEVLKLTVRIVYDGMVCYEGGAAGALITAPTVVGAPVGAVAGCAVGLGVSEATGLNKYPY